MEKRTVRIRETFIGWQLDCYADGVHASTVTYRTEARATERAESWVRSGSTAGAQWVNPRYTGEVR